MVLKLSFVLFFILFVYSKSDFSIVQAELSTSLSNEEMQALDQLRPLVMKHLYKDYMKQDHYLVRFLRARKLNVEDTKEMLLGSLNWRKHNRIDTIIGEKLKVEKFFPYWITKDLEGRPFGSIRAGDWQLRRYLIGGRYGELVRLVFKVLEISMEEIRESALATGKNITQGQAVADLSGFNSREHACLLCIRFYTDLIGSYEKNFPQIADNFISVNTPKIFQTVWDIIKTIMSDYTRNSVSLYGYDRNEWRSKLLGIISDDQLPGFLGGSNIDPPSTKWQ